MSHVQALPLKSSVSASAAAQGHVSNEIAAYFAPPSILQSMDKTDVAVAAVGVVAVARAVYAHSMHYVVRNLLGRCRSR